MRRSSSAPRCMRQPVWERHAAGAACSAACATPAQGHSAARHSAAQRGTHSSMSSLHRLLAHAAASKAGCSWRRTAAAAASTAAIAGTWLQSNGRSRWRASQQGSQRWLDTAMAGGQGAVQPLRGSLHTPCTHGRALSGSQLPRGAAATALGSAHLSRCDHSCTANLKARQRWFMLGSRCFFFGACCGGGDGGAAGCAASPPAPAAAPAAARTGCMQVRWPLLRCCMPHLLPPALVNRPACRATEALQPAARPRNLGQPSATKQRRFAETSQPQPCPQPT